MASNSFESCKRATEKIEIVAPEKRVIEGEEIGLRTATGQGDIYLESAAFIRSAKRTRNGAKQATEIVSLWGHFNARSFDVFAAFLKLLLNPAKVDHLRPSRENFRGRPTNTKEEPEAKGLDALCLSLIDYGRVGSSLLFCFPPFFQSYARGATATMTSNGRRRAR